MFLSPAPPSDAMVRLLNTHPQSHRLLYVQGSPLRQEVRARRAPPRAGRGVRGQPQPPKQT